MLFPIGKSLLGKTVPKFLDTARGHTPDPPGRAVERFKLNLATCDEGR